MPPLNQLNPLTEKASMRMERIERIKNFWRAVYFVFVRHTCHPSTSLRVPRRSMSLTFTHGNAFPQRGQIC
jgi:hypothetical protein